MQLADNKQVNKWGTKLPDVCESDEKLQINQSVKRLFTP